MFAVERIGPVQTPAAHEERKVHNGRKGRKGVVAALAAASLLLSAGCASEDGGPASSDGSPTPPAGSASSPAASSSPPAKRPPAKGSVDVVSTLTEKLSSPWGLAPLPGGDLLVASRDDATITRIDGESGKKTEVGTVPGVSPAGEGGLLGLAVAPTYGADHLVYAYFTTESDNRIARLQYDEAKPAGQQLGAPDTILRGIPKGSVHNGGRIAFGPDRMLYAGTGETGDTGLAQDEKSLAGKILRMTPDGEPVHGNPSADSVVYSWGHRNVQGLAWDERKRLWASEFGQDTWDELNAIEPGKNYGWPEVEGEKGEAGYVDPVAQWKTSEASPSGIAYAQGSIWMAGLRGERLWRIPLSGTPGEEPSAAPQAFLEGKYGRLRTVVAAGGDTLWLVTSNTDGRGTPKQGDDRILLLKVR
ncbi:MULTISPECIES: sorbosone dehydrogenase family protein [unclassified Streptomyces]|uniref:PQQ-dependent sugar dehydrogenase n=1 Tax=Streptomyces TaxID=1883 RepID=UPI00036A7F7F|nr:MULTISPECIES: PQQ-dependent sugar dehydrogenase [unclassified Streptomyces]MYR69923.1 PQQ-dependent sugar dehydrogenase [Streptomyces sp. SID4939]MYT88798.1 PQQ-dependent sugar dehydrogenase [Streptomyces sp. SID8360]MYW39988.1 PQQ-dependent sugar dehydrogenase [Streptomyces sp. SID1]MYS01161.1 PQQ-dependent sugar dehydrogenase [Streptomyces sp. SID4940]MYT62926.1 PQQ-dependent sugar dehydrogenase [Streptomyces sp. SID8357]